MIHSLAVVTNLHSMSLLLLAVKNISGLKKLAGFTQTPCSLDNLSSPSDRCSTT